MNVDQCSSAAPRSLNLANFFGQRGSLGVRNTKHEVCALGLAESFDWNNCSRPHIKVVVLAGPFSQIRPT